MNVLIVSPFFPFPEDSGSKIRLASLIRSLNGHRVTLIAFRDKDESIHEEEMNGACAAWHVFDRPRLSRFRKWLNPFSPNPLLIHRFFARSAWRQAREIMRGGQVDVLVIETLLMVRYARKAPVALRVLDEHNLEFVRAAGRLAVTKGRLARTIDYLIMARLRRFETRAIRRFDRCLVCSQEDRDILAGQVNGESLVVVPNAVDTERYQPRPAPANGKKIVFLGTLSYEPNRDAVLFFSAEILPQLRPRVPGLKFVIIGPGPSRDVAALARQGDVTVTGYVDDIRPFLADASVVVAPLRMGSGTRLKILTAMAMGVPVVSTAIGCMGIQATDGKDICIADAAEDFCDRIQRLLTDVQFREQIGRGGRELVVSRYSRDVVLRQLGEFWAQAARGSGS
ncbi:MAG: glycosyltransferase family 4 protein [Acidobacteria bacterium]|jgi:glycosyltransferase involved in cell wall biosynthesis|nr:glycosyltransferase family 4 protein [Acidobacteriota bacterium]